MGVFRWIWRKENRSTTKWWINWAWSWGSAYVWKFSYLRRWQRRTSFSSTSLRKDGLQRFVKDFNGGQKEGLKLKIGFMGKGWDEELVGI